MSRPGRRPAPRRRVLWAGLLGLAVAAAACGDPAAAGTVRAGAATWVIGSGGTLTVGIDAAPTGCNPDIAAGDTWADRFVLAPVLPSAFDVDAKDQAVYDSAIINQAELQSTTPQTVVYTINPKAVWSDGTPVTAADFIYTWRQQRGSGAAVGTSGSGEPATAPGSASGAGTVAATVPGTATTALVGPTTLPGATGTTGTLMGYRQIQSIKGSNHGRTVTVVFTTPYADWKALFDDLLPAHVMKKTGWSPPCSTVEPSVDLSAGPYVIAKVVPGKEVVLEHNSHWWEQRPNLDRIVIKTARSSAQLASWLVSGKVQVALPTSFDEQFLERISASPSIDSRASQSTTFLQLELSTTSALTSSLAVREAVGHAVDRQQLVSQVVGWADTAIVPGASHLYAEDQSGYPSPRQLPIQIAAQSTTTTTSKPKTPTAARPFPTRADPTATEQLLADAGYLRRANGTWTIPGGAPLTLRIAVDSGDVWAARSAPVLARELTAVGIGAVLVDEPTATAAGTALSSGVVDAALLPMHGTPFSTTAIAWYTPLLGSPGQGGSQDWTNFDDPSLNRLLVKASGELNPGDATPIYTQADMLLWQQMVALPLFTQPGVLAWSASVGGITADLNGPNLLSTVATWGMLVPPTSPRASGALHQASSS